MYNITIIMPTYNRSYIISKAIDSVMSQKYSDYELIIIDDGSTDNTESIVKNYSDSRIKYIKLENNKGGNFARNIGLKNACGEYVAFLDSDNIWEDCYLETAVKQIEGTNSDLFFCRTEINNSNNKSTFPSMKHSEIELNDYDSLRLLLCFGNVIDLNTLVVKRSVVSGIDGFDNDLKRFQDYDLVSRIFEHKIHYVFYDCVMVKNYVQDNSISNNKKEYWNARLKIFNRQLKYCRQIGCVYDLVYYLVNTLLSDNPEEGIEYKILESLQPKDFIGIFSLLNEKDTYMDMLNENIERLDNIIKEKSWAIKGLNISKNSKVSIYGYGDVGKDIERQLSEDKGFEIVSIYDKNYKEYLGKKNIKNPEDISCEEFDYIVIALIDDEICIALKEKIISKGISADKIMVAKDYFS